MRSNKEMMDIIINIAKEDHNIISVIMSGSRVNAIDYVDEYSDYDIIYIVKNLRCYIEDKRWLEQFGDRLMMQEPDDWHSHPYDITSQKPYSYLMQFKDGNRIDLTLVAMENYKGYLKGGEKRDLLYTKDASIKIESFESDYRTTLPTEKAFSDVMNEFLWVSLYVAKGLKRQQLLYAKSIYDQILIQQYFLMLKWWLVIKEDKDINFGPFNRFLLDYLTPDEVERIKLLMPNGYEEDIKHKTIALFKAFNTLSIKVADHMGFTYRENDLKDVFQELTNRMSISEV